jgi:methyl-accepting chemotaxis protein
MKAEDQVAVAKAVQETYPWMYLVFMTGLDGKSVARSDGKPQADYSDRSYFRDVALLGQPVAWQNLIGKTSNQPALVLAVPIHANGNLVGVMAAAMTIEQISKVVASWHKGTTGHAFIVDERDKVIAHPRADYVTAQQNLHEHPLIRVLRTVGRQTGLTSFTSPEGVATVGVARSNRYNWALVVEQEDAETFAGLRRARLVTGALLAVTLLLVGLVAWRTGAALVRPIVRLTSLADRVSLGELDVRVEIRSQDEIGQLAASFGRLQTSLRKAMERLGREAAPAASPLESSHALRQRPR